MRLHENPKLFIDSIRATANRMGIADIYVEKDYWVTYALHVIFNDTIGKDTVFKGGTALSKCFGVIKRFSEDVDLVMVRHTSEGTSAMERKVKKPSKVLDAYIPEIKVEGLTHKMGMLRKTVHQYKKQLKGDFGQVRDFIVLEATYLGRYEPFYTTSVNSYIGEMMLEVGQKELAVEKGLLPFEVQVMHEHRTICEKIMSLVRFSYGENPVVQLGDKIRHAYDIHQLLTLESVNVFFNSTAFDEMLKNVATDDRLSFKSNNDWLDNHPKEALLFSNTEDVWSSLRNTYSQDFARLVYGELPQEVEILKTLKRVSERLNQKSNFS